MSLSVIAYSQVGVTGYSNFAIGINSPTNRMLGGEIKIFPNTDINDVIFEVDAFYNFKPRTYHRFSIGLGIASSPRNFHGIQMPGVLEIYPLQDFKRLSLLMEISPEVLRDYINLRSLLGVRYSFGD
jgi:hypothetical protein